MATFDRLRQAFPNDLLEERYQKFRFGHNERTLRETPRCVESPLTLLIKYLRQGGNGPLWSEKGYKFRPQRLALHELGRPVLDARLEGWG